MPKRKADSQIVKFDSRPLKVVNRSNFLVCRWCAWHVVGKLSTRATTLFQTSLWLKVCTKRYGLSKVMGIPTLGISKLPFGSPRIKWQLSAGPMAKHIIYYKGEGGGFSQVRAMVNLMSLCLPVACPCSKKAQTMH
jgi:hypothetical protein